MNFLNKYKFVLLLLLLAAGCSDIYKVGISDSSGSERSGEMVVIHLKDIPDAVGKRFIVKNEQGLEIPYQITHDSLLIFQANPSQWSCLLQNCKMQSYALRHACMRNVQAGQER